MGGSQKSYLVEGLVVKSGTLLATGGNRTFLAHLARCICIQVGLAVVIFGSFILLLLILRPMALRGCESIC